MSFQLRNFAALPLLIFVAWLARAGSVPTVSIQTSPSNPTAGQVVALRDSSGDDNDDFFWSFGDGEAGRSAAVAHSWAEPGTYMVHLESQGGSAEIPIVVSPADALRLVAAHPFEVTVEAQDPGTGARSAGRALAQNDRSGFFVFPGITGDPESPDVSVKIVEAAWAGRYWIFYGSLTSVEFTLTVRDVSTGQVEIYRKEGTVPCGGFDPSSFPFASTPAPAGPARPQESDSTEARMPVIAVPGRHGTGTRLGSRGATATPAVPPTSTNTPPSASTPTFTPSGTKTPSVSPTPTRTPTLTRTPTVTPTPTITQTPTTTQTPTITPTPAPPFVRMQVVQWQWNFYVDPSGDINNCYPVVKFPCAPLPEPDPPTAEITFQIGKTYRLMIVNADGPDVLVFHGFGGIPEIPELPRLDMIPQGTAWGPYTMTPMIAGDFSFQCLATACGNPQQHEQMLGIMHVVP